MDIPQEALRWQVVGNLDLLFHLASVWQGLKTQISKNFAILASFTRKLGLMGSVSHLGIKKLAKVSS